MKIKKLLKAVLLMGTVFMVMLTLCAAEGSSLPSLLILSAVDCLLIIICTKVLSKEDVHRYSGISIWEKYLN